MADKPFIISKDLQVGDGSAAGTTDALLRVDDTNNRVGINTATPTGTLDVTVASSGDRGLIVRSVSSQTTRSFEILRANGSGVFSIDPSGSVYFSPWSGTQTSSIRYDAPTNGLVFTGSGTSANPIELNVLSDSTLSFEGTAGQLFSVADGLSSGTIFAVSDISGMPSLEIDASGLIKLGEFDGFVGVGTSQTYGQYSGKMEINYPSGYKGLIVRPGSAEIRNALEVQNSSSGTVFSVDPYGATVIDLTTSTTSKGLIIQAATSQAANLQEWQNASSTVLASVNQEGRFSGVSYNASSGVILQAATPSSTTNTLYNVGGSLYFNGSAVGGSIETLTFGSGLSGSTSSTFDGTSAVTVNLGGTGTLNQLRFTSNQINIGNMFSPGVSSYDYINIGVSAGENSSGNQYGINIGRQAGLNAKSHASSVSIGLAANQSSSGINDSIAIGISAGYFSKNVLSSVYIGSYAGYISTGNYNTYIGTYAGYYASGNNNIEITASGSSSNVLLAGLNSNKINIGSTIAGDISNKKLAIGNVSSSNLSPNSTVEILPKETTDKSLILKGTSSYATNFLEVQDSSSTANLYIDQNYNLVTTGNVVANSGAFNVLDLTPIPDTSYPAWQEGLVFYDDDNKSLTLYNDVSDVSQQLGQEFYIRAKNVSVSGTIYNGQVVHIEGANGQHPTIELAFAGDEEASRVIGVATHDILYNDFGYVTMLGTVRGVNTDGYSAGDRLFLSSSVSGAFTTGIPAYPNYNTRVGYVITPHPSNGSILVVPYAPRKAGTQLVAPASDGRSSGVAFFSTDDLLVTDPTFYYSSGNQTLFLNNIDAPTGIIDKIVFGSGSLAFTDGGGGVVLTSLQHSSGSYLQTTLGQGSYTYTNVYLKDSPSDQSYAWGGWATTTTESNLAWNYSSNFGAGLYYGRSIKINGTDITLESATAGGATLPTKVWTTNSVLTQGYSDTRYAVTSGVVAATTASPGYLNTLLNANISGVAYRIPMLPSGATNVALSGNIGINTTSPGASLEVDALSSATKGVIVKGAVSQTANLLELQNSSSTNLLYANTTGLLTTLPIYAHTYSAGWGMEVKNTANFSSVFLIKNGNDTYPPDKHFEIQNAAGTKMFGILNNSISTYGNNINFNGGYAHTYSGGNNLTYGAMAGRRFANTNAAHNIFYGEWAGGSSDGGVSATANAINNFVHGYFSFGYYTATGTLDSNFIFGRQSCVSIQHGSHNFSFGAGSFPLQVGSYNVNLGQAGMGSLATGNYNVSIGQGTVFPATCDYSIALGRAAIVDKSNQLVIGSTSYKIGGSSAGESGVTNTSPGYLSKLLEAKINGTAYNIPLLPSGSTNVALSGTIGINTTSPGASLEVDALSSTTKGVIVKGAVSQTANLQEWKNSAGNNLLEVQNDGDLVFSSGNQINFTDTGWATRTANYIQGPNTGYGVLGFKITPDFSIFAQHRGNWYNVNINGSPGATYGYDSYYNSCVFIGGYAGAALASGSRGGLTLVGVNTVANGGPAGDGITAIGGNAISTPISGTAAIVAVGDNAATRGGAYNTAVGSYARHQGSGQNNTAVGYFAQAQYNGVDTNSSNCTFVGSNAGANASGSNNIGVGYNATNGNRGGGGNIGIGNSSLIGTYGGYGLMSNSIAIGHDTLKSYGENYGSYNIAVGHGAGSDTYWMISGNYNVFLGMSAGYGIRSGDYNVAIGYRAGAIPSAHVTGIIAIGDRAQATQNYQLVLGSSSRKIGKGDGTGEQSVSSTTPSGISKLLQATINGSTYQIPLLPSGATNLAAISGGSSGYIPIWDSASSLTYDSSLAYSTSGKYFTYTGTGVSANPMKMKILDDSTLSFESTDGQLFSISDGLQSGRIFAVNDISGMPFIEVDASGLVKIAEYDGVVGIGTSQTYGQYSGKVEITYPSGLGGLISRPASGAPGNAIEVQTFSSGTVFTVSQSGTISSTLQGQTAKGLVVKAGTSQTANLIELQDSAGTPVLTISPSGSISGAIAPGIITTSSSPYSLTDTHHGKIVEYTGTSSGTFNIGTITIPGWNCMLVNLGSGIIVGANGNTLYSPDNMSGTRTKYSSLSLYYRGSNTFVLAGDLA